MSLKAIVRHVFASPILAAVTLLVAATGCTATLTTTPVRARVLYSYPVVHVDAAPVHVYEGPRVLYHGRPAYLVGTRWYYPADGGWVYFSEEPRELRHYRQKRHSRVEPRAARRRVAEPRRVYVEPPRETRRRRYY